ncbi:uncharacterized protein LOC127103190 [Lathyrus oleraceus]|uniref:uncharacterized protein LOC127103190 n=1 Tax=Pisum sativum TaxID=3888 RepID=UPI0021D0F62D|nr:uncharacterized protein LOC127103190 [Pisum sativum]
MDFGRKKTQKYTFKSPKLEDLRRLGSLVVDIKAFNKRYGHFLSLLKINMADGLLSTLIQFIDPVYHCFTFPDYQLMPTLEEYSHLIGVPISSQAPFFGLEEDPKDQDIAKATHLKMSEIRDHMTTKGKMLGLTAKFLMNKAQYFARMRNVDAFEAVFALLIYGLFLFPSFDDFIAMDAIKIFLIENPVPTLLADAYHFVHMRNSYSGGMITCCVPILYKWFISHLPRYHAFWDLKDGLLWSHKITSLTHSDIVWYSREYDGVSIIDSCGGFSNVPLLGTRRGISYNPILAQRQLGYPMRDKPKNINLEGLFFKECENCKTLKEKIVHARCHVHKLEKKVLGKTNYVSLEPYLKWVQDRAISVKIPYPRQEPLPLADKEPTYIFMADAEKLKIALTTAQRERDAWKNKCQIINNEYEELQRQLKM